jgi:hypothetical protein
MRLWKLALLSMFVSLCATLNAQMVLCGATVDMGLGEGNSCPCGGSTYFFPTAIGVAAIYPAHCSGTCSERYQVSTSKCIGTVAVRSKTLEGRLVALAMPKEMLLTSCRGGLYPVQVDNLWFDDADVRRWKRFTDEMKLVGD